MENLLRNYKTWIIATALLLAGIVLGSLLIPGNSATQTVESLAVGYPSPLPKSIPVHFTINGITQTRLTTAPTVAGALAQNGHVLSALDQVYPSRKAPITPNMAVQLTTVNLVTNTQTVQLPYTTITHPDPTLLAGFTRVITAGVNGLARETVRTKYVGGKPVQETILQQALLQPPTAQTLAMGDLHTITRGGMDYHFERAIPLLSTAYWPDPSWSNGITAMGLHATYGIVAVDPRIIPLGTRLYVDGYGPALAADTGAAIKGSRIDLCFNTGWQAIDYGVKWLNVYVMSP